jgi:LSD1 subclass zinc finger protein
MKIRQRYPPCRGGEKMLGYAAGVRRLRCSVGFEAITTASGSARLVPD